MADTANDVRVVAAAETGIARRRGGCGCAPVSMPVVDRVATAVTPIVLIIGKYFGWTRHLARLAGPPEDRCPVTGDLTALLGGAAARFFLRHHPMFSINSLCRLFGKQDYDRADGRNLAFRI